MTDLTLEQACPACGTQMMPASLACHCGVSISGPIRVNEFATMGQEELQFLRLFVMFEGRIRDLEKALGISYPTVKGRIRDLKRSLNLTSAEDPAQSAPAPAPVGDVLLQLESGEVSVDEALAKLEGDSDG